MTQKAIFPGTFDPFTIGHYRIVERGLQIFDKIVIGIGVNTGKRSLFTVEQRKDIIKQAFADNDRVSVESYDCLTVDFARNVGAQCVLRGLRTVADFEYERSMAEANAKLAGLETIVLYTDAENAFVSSTVVRDLYLFGKDITPFLPPKVSINKIIQ
ncbi:MAG TPA: pantetheine-phosphate adenylyltransferase [Bacteroidales bacterium]|jgi:pantetheine-phosphate adenylyltransferase|nr:pantetheine-phosphate adenylyltransferase [Bacteroidales bacterium]